MSYNYSKTALQKALNNYKKKHNNNQKKHKINTKRLNKLKQNRQNLSQIFAKNKLKHNNRNNSCKKGAFITYIDTETTPPLSLRYLAEIKKEYNKHGIKYIKIELLIDRSIKYDLPCSSDRLILLPQIRPTRSKKAKRKSTRKPKSSRKKSKRKPKRSRRK